MGSPPGSCFYSNKLCGGKDAPLERNCVDYSRWNYNLHDD